MEEVRVGMVIEGCDIECRTPRSMKVVQENKADHDGVSQIVIYHCKHFIDLGLGDDSRSEVMWEVERVQG